MSAAETLELLKTAEAAVADAADAYQARANASAEPTDYRAATYIGNARRLLAAALVELGAVEVCP